MPGLDFAQLMSHVVGRVAGVVETQDEATNRAIRFVGQLQANAFGRWSEVARTGLRCSVRYREPGTDRIRHCKSPGAAACLICRNPVCFDHGMFAPDGTAVCRSCVEALRKPTSPSAPDTRDELRRHLKTLRLRRGATPEEVRRAYKRLAAKWHPDRFPEAEKATANAKFIELGAARDWLLKHLEERAAA